MVMIPGERGLMVANGSLLELAGEGPAVGAGGGGVGPAVGAGEWGVGPAEGAGEWGLGPAVAEYVLAVVGEDDVEHLPPPWL